MDLGLNHVVRKNIFQVDQSAHHLIAVPGDDGPGGVLVVCEDFVQYIKQDHEPRKCFIPIRHDSRIAKEFNGGRKLFITSSATFSSGDLIFFLL
jgi:splicing factor 3B subunit 3